MRKSVKYSLNAPAKPIKRESDKRVVYEALQKLAESQDGSFTKAEALETMNGLKERDEVNSIQPAPTFGRAWWNEFANKYGLIVEKQDA